MTDNEWIRMLIPLLAVSVGFMLGQWDAWRRNRAANRGARALVRMEIDDNLAEVCRYRSEAQVRSLDEMLPPAWQKEAWQSQLPRLPGALDLGRLARTRRFYQRLDLLAEHHQRARAAKDDPDIQAQEVAAAEVVTRLLISEGNPLEPSGGERLEAANRARRWRLHRLARERALAGLTRLTNQPRVVALLPETWLARQRDQRGTSRATDDVATAERRELQA